MIIFSHLNTFTYLFIKFTVLGTVLGTEVKKKNKTCLPPSRSTRKRGQAAATDGAGGKLGGRAGFQGPKAGNRGEGMS